MTAASPKRIGVASFGAAPGLDWHTHELTDIEREMIAGLVETSRRAIARKWFQV